MTPAERILALELEFERLKQRADYLDHMLQGHPETWAGIQALIPDGCEVVIDKMVGEARQTATAMTTVLRALAQLTAPEMEKPAADPLDEIARKREQRAQAK